MSKVVYRGVEYDTTDRPLMRMETNSIWKNPKEV